MIIRGYWNDSRCGGSVACVQWGSGYPYLSGVRFFRVESPPRYGGGPAGQWTDSWSEYMRQDMNRLVYLPALMMHEFGHVIGLGHTTRTPYAKIGQPGEYTGGAIMGGAKREIPPCVPSPDCGLDLEDILGARAIYR